MYVPPDIYKLHIEAQDCYVCHRPFSENNYKVRDHNHLIGEYKGAAHNRCNLDERYAKCIPVFMHNLTNYDSHLFIKELGKYSGKLSIIPENSEKSISMSQKFTNIFKLQKFKFLNLKKKVFPKWEWLQNTV